MKTAQYILPPQNFAVMITHIKTHQLSKISELNVALIAGPSFVRQDLQELNSDALSQGYAGIAIVELIQAYELTMILFYVYFGLDFQDVKIIPEEEVRDYGQPPIT